MTGRGSLSRRLARLISGGFAAIWLLAVLATALVLRSEQEEMLNLELRETARVLLPVLARDVRDGTPVSPAPTGAQDPDDTPAETLAWFLTDRTGRILRQSAGSDTFDRPAGAVSEGYSETATHVFYTTAPNPEGLSLRFGDPKSERREAYLESLLAFLLPMLAILPLGYLLVGWIARSALAPLGRLRDEIAKRDQGSLDPIDTRGLDAELREITSTLNGFMIRLARSLDGERAFATNAAHELRTPVAVALAQAQRLRAELGEADRHRVDRIEEALRRMSRLVARLLQLARADAGIGLSDRQHDIASLLEVLADDHRRDPGRAARLVLSRPDGPVMARIDPDAFGIVVGNLVDNAFQNAPAGSPVEITLTRDATLTVRNECAVVPPETLDQLTRRFRRNGNATRGFGLGLHISDTIARQAGGRLHLGSPCCGRSTGFEAVVRLPVGR